VKPQDAPLYGFLAAVAAAQAAEEMGIPEAKLKWPNDVLVNNRKLCGILSEAELRNGSISGMIIGVGFNLNSRAEDFPIELRERATSVKRETGREYPIEQAAELILIRVASLCSEVRTEGLGVVLDLWNDRWAHKGATVVVNGVEGTALRVDCTGALLVRDLSGRELWIRAGDVEPAAAREAGV
jgi:BirA family biotin operon repressor/biotin-[acetyl-CoA-carboxylase] ligase